MPDHAFSLFTTYDLPHDIQVGYGVTYQGEYYLSQHAQIAGSTPAARTTIPLVKAPDYLVHRLTVAWAPNRQTELLAQRQQRVRQGILPARPQQRLGHAGRHAATPR